MANGFSVITIILWEVWFSDRYLIGFFLSLSLQAGGKNEE